AVCAALESEHVVQVSDYGVTSAGHPYCVMEFLEGQTLGQLLAKERPLSPERAIRIATQVCVGLQVAHRGVILKPNRSRKRVHVVHRDLKPDNIFLVPHPVWGEMVKILDFGIAKLYWEQWTNSNATSYGFKGSLRYAAPEQWAGSDRLDGRTDLYSLGVVLYEMLSGTNPFGIDKARDTSLQSWLEAHTRAEPIPLNRQPGCEHLAPDLVAAVMRCLAKSPEDRFASADDLRAALEPYMPQATVPPTGVAAPKRLPARSSSLNLPVPPHLLSHPPQTARPLTASVPPSVPVVDVFHETSTTRGSSDPTITLSPFPTEKPVEEKGSPWLWGALGTAAIAALAGGAWLWGNPRALNEATALADAGNYAEAIEVASAIPSWQRTHENAMALVPQWHYDQALTLANAGDYQTALGWVERFPTPEARELVGDLARMMDVEAAMGDRQFDRVVVSSSNIPAASPLFSAARSRMCQAVSANLSESVRAQLTTSMSGEQT
ncbi:MAG: serine/threonine-protein kinase, partial [Cyanobacteria bacterium J06639_1]